MAITIKTIYNTIIPFIKATPFEINMLMVEACSQLGEDIHISTSKTIVHSSADLTTYDIPDDYLSIRKIYINDEEIPEKYDVYDTTTGSYYTIDNVKRLITFSFTVLTTDKFVIEAVTELSNSNLTFDDDTTFEVPANWITPIKYYILYSLSEMNDYFNAGMALEYKNRYKETLNKLKKSQYVSDQYMDLGSYI